MGLAAAASAFSKQPGWCRLSFSSSHCMVPLIRPLWRDEPTLTNLSFFKKKNRSQSFPPPHCPHFPQFTNFTIYLSPSSFLSVPHTQTQTQSEWQLFPAPASSSARQAQMLISTFKPPLQYSPHPPMSGASPRHLAPGWLLPVWGLQWGELKGRGARTRTLGMGASFMADHIITAVRHCSGWIICGYIEHIESFYYEALSGWGMLLLLGQHAHNWHISNDMSWAGLPSPLASACPLCLSGNHKRGMETEAPSSLLPF